MTDLSKDMERDLAALADGSLAAERRERVLQRVRGSRELQQALDEQRRVVELTAGIDARAPASLRREVEAMLTPRRRRRAFAMPRAWVASAGALAVVVAVVLAVGLSGRPAPPASSGFSVRQAAALTLSPATIAAPAQSRTHPAQLTASVGDVPFPYWQDRFGWRSVGAREDRLAGHAVTTVFYANAGGRRIGYAILAGPAPATHGGTVVWRSGVSYRLLTEDGATVVTWQRGGQLCVVSGRAMSARTLLSLASSSAKKA
jgi:hypothetical protein